MINKTSFNGRRELTCYSCHHGVAHPASIPAVLETDEPERRAETPPPAAPTATADQILEKYVAALGGADALKKVTSRVESGSVQMGSREMPIEVYAKAPNMRVSIMHMGERESITAFDGKSGWLGGGDRPPREMSAAESDAAGLDAQFNLALADSRHLSAAARRATGKNRRHPVPDPHGYTSGPARRASLFR